MKKGDVVRNNCQNKDNPYRHQIVIGTFSTKGVDTIDYMGKTHKFNNGKDHLEVIGHSKEYDEYVNFLTQLANYEN